MSITEKELAEKFHNEFPGAVASSLWPSVARRAAELLGVTLAPEKPEPGIYVLDGKPVVIYSDEGGKIGHHVDSWNASRPVPDRHRIKPARVISEAEYTNLLAEVASLQESLDKARDFQRTLQREKDEWEANAEEAGREVERLSARVIPTKPHVLTDEEIGEVFQNASFNYHWRRLPALAGMRPSDMQEDIIQFAHALLAKHGGARELPRRNEVWDAIEGVGFYGTGVALATDAVMALLKGGGDE